MMRLSAFADEISPDLDEQITVLRAENIRYIDLRSVWDTNVLELSNEQVDTVRAALDSHRIRVAAIGSPIGKTPIDRPIEDTLIQFKSALMMAIRFRAQYIRIFSFYPPAGAEPADPASYRDDVLNRLRALVERAGNADTVLLHENEKDVYGDTVARCVDLMTVIDDEYFRVAFDPANFIQCGETPYPDGYEALRSRLGYVHVKDAQADGTVVAAGEGVGRWPELLTRLRDDGYDGFLSLEPHLAAAERFQGFSGPDLFRHASQSLQALLREAGIEYS